MLGQETPSSVMYQDLKAFGGISNKEAARVLLSGRVGAGGRAPRERVGERTFLSREVVHVLPGQVNRALYADLAGASQTLLGRVTTATGRPAALEHYLGPAAIAMQGALAQYGLDALVYGNEVRRIASVRLRREDDRVLLAFMLFVGAGCLADPAAAVGVVERFAQRTLVLDIGTVESASAPSAGAPDTAVSLGLLRLVDGVARPPIYPLDPSGSVVGSLASGPGAVTDVDVDVSRRHLRVWRDGNRWLCQGLGSTNGTVLVSGQDKGARIVEPPRAGRHGTGYPPVELERGDVLCLGRSTRFLVMALQATR